MAPGSIPQSIRACMISGIAAAPTSTCSRTVPSLTSQPWTKSSSPSTRLAAAVTAGSATPAAPGGVRSTSTTSPEISRFRSAGVPSATISPASMIETRSHSASASSR